MENRLQNLTSGMIVLRVTDSSVARKISRVTVSK